MKITLKLTLKKQFHNEHLILNFYKKMIQLRKNHEVFTLGSYDISLPDDKQIFAYQRKHQNKKELTITNISIQQATWISESNTKISSNQLVLNNYYVPTHKATKEITLKPFEARVYII